MTTVIGIIGGVGSGKSTVASLCAAAGAYVIDADQVAHEALLAPMIRDRVVAAFGPDVADASGNIVRARLGEMVFGAASRDRLHELESIVHPWVRQVIDGRLDEATRRGERVVVLDIPLLLESTHRASCDHVVFVRSTPASRQARVAARGWDRDELQRREGRQTALDVKESAADHVIDNDGDLETLAARVQAMLHDLIADSIGGMNG